MRMVLRYRATKSGDRAVFLESKGYRLRPRFLPGWTPSWKTRSLDPYLCEDGVIHHVSSKGRI